MYFALSFYKIFWNGPIFRSRTKFLTWVQYINQFISSPKVFGTCIRKLAEITTPGHMADNVHSFFCQEIGIKFFLTKNKNFCHSDNGQKRANESQEKYIEAIY